MAVYYQHEQTSDHNNFSRNNNKSIPTWMNCNTCLYLNKIEKQMLKDEADYYAEIERQHNEELKANEQK